MSRLTALGILTAIAAMFFVAPQHLAHAAANSVAISVDMHLTGQTTAEGTFTASGAINDAGRVTQTFQIAADGSSVQGVKTLNGSRGDIVIHFNGAIMPIEGGSKLQVTGTWQVESGTRAYSGISGGGQLSTILDVAAGTLHADYTGDISMGGGAAAPRGMPRTGGPSESHGSILTLAVAAILVGGLTLAARKLFRAA